MHDGMISSNQQRGINNMDYVEKVINSCKTMEHLVSCHDWVNNLSPDSDKWVYYHSLLVKKRIQLYGDHHE